MKRIINFLRKFARLEEESGLLIEEFTDADSFLIETSEGFFPVHSLPFSDFSSFSSRNVFRKKLDGGGNYTAKNRLGIYYCPHCLINDIQSNVKLGESKKISFAEPLQFYDGADNFHEHSSAIIEQELKCTAKHKWIEKYPLTLCWCGWEPSV